MYYKKITAIKLTKNFTSCVLVQGKQPHFKSILQMPFHIQREATIGDGITYLDYLS